MPETIGGIPLHPLVVHAVVVLIPLAALGVITIALVPKWRSRFGILVVGVAAFAAVMVPIATSSGEQLQESKGGGDLIDEHAELGGAALYSAIPLLIFAVVLWWLGLRAGRDAPVSRWLNWLVPALAIGVAVVAIVQMVLIGHSGAKAVWSGA
ncbi:MAG: hypothetical protein LH645_04320 [Actinomycetia bacterium]|nr:hypothetical protein [Actinomycetes bacterium]